MSEVFIYKPIGVSVNEDLRKSLAKKYALGYMLYSCTDKNKVWQLPNKKLAKTDMEKDFEPYSKDLSSLIYFNDSATNAYQRKNFFFDDTEGAWSLYFPSFKIKSINDGYSNSCKFPYNHSEDSSASVLYDRFLKHIPNARKLKLMNFLKERDGTESAFICNGAVHLITQNLYDIDGVKISNLDHENDLPADIVKTLSVALALLGFQKDASADPKELISQFSSLPHREIKSKLQEVGLEEFWKKII